jgi:HD-like signal output (HDOD) protein
MIVEANNESARTPIANLRPRILDVTAMGRVHAIRVPDFLLNRNTDSGTQADLEQTASANSEQEEQRDTGMELAFQLYRDLENGESSILPSLPDTAVRIQLAIEDELSDAEAVARLAMTDPAIAAKLIMTANSALYGGRTAVDTCTAAVVRLGMNTTRQLVLTFALKEVFRTKDKALRQRMKTLWDHSVQIAATCFVLARQIEGVQPEEALLAGLVHDVGAIAIINHAAHGPQLESDPASLEQMIARLCGELGALILRRWGFVSAVVLAARDAECWLRHHDGPADLTDLLIVAQVHEHLHRNDLTGLPEIEHIPAFAKVLGEDASPQTSLAILRKTEALVDEIRSVLRR